LEDSCLGGGGERERMDGRMDEGMDGWRVGWRWMEYVRMEMTGCMEGLDGGKEDEHLDLVTLVPS